MPDFPGMGRWVKSRRVLSVTSALLMAFGLPQVGADSITELRTTVATLTRQIDENPDSASAYQSRGVAYFELGEFKKSISDFDRFIQLYPNQEPHHWQRGIAYYYAHEYEKGVQQFELHKSVNPNDVENAVWHFLCKAKLENVQAARDSLIPIKFDSRTPMVQIWELFSGIGSPEKVLLAAGPIDTGSGISRQRHCYAHLYIGLYHEALGQTELVKKHISLAANEFSMSNYMGMVARVHNRLINH